MKQTMTLCVVSQDGKLLLGMKKRGFGAGRWNGFGGKVQDGEPLEAAATRELKEEVGIESDDLKRVGSLHFTHEEGEGELEVHVFHVTEFSGTPVETEEMEPDWFPYNEIPFVQMWPDDEIWLPLVLTHKKFVARFHLDKPSTAEYMAQILSHEIDVVDELPELMGESEAD